ncbi:MAG: hypothetical protein ABIJ09_16605 [Pseudomonadota bacterium]
MTLCSAALLLGLLSLSSTRAATPPGRELLNQITEQTFAGDYDVAEHKLRELGQQFPNHPAGDFYQASVLFWRINPDLSNAEYDARIILHLQQCIAKALPLADVDTTRVDGLHYLGLCNTYLGRLEAQRGNLYAGGSRGEKGRDHLERAIALCQTTNSVDPTCEDLYFPFGAYAYYAGRLPRFMQWMNFLWFVPRGSTEQGLMALERARTRSTLHGLGATSLLANIYTLFEPGRSARGLELSSQLIARFPDNPYLDVEHANVLLASSHAAQALEHARQAVGKSAKGVRNYDAPTALNAHLAEAEALLCLGRLDDAEGVLRGLRRDPRFDQLTGTPRIALLQGMLADLRGERAKAILLYEEARDHEGRTWNRQASKLARKYLEDPYRGQPQPAP